MEENTRLTQGNQSGITIEALTSSNHEHQILLRGRFSILRGQGGVPEQPPQVLKHIVTVVTRSANYQALTPFKDVVVFEDDVHVDGRKVSASFNINVMDHIAFDGPGDYYILCSLGTHLSNIVMVSLK